MEGHINGKTVAPDVISEKAADGKTVKTANLAYEEWFAGDKQILGFLFASVSKEVFVQIATSQTAAQAWQAVGSWITAQSRARSINVRLALSTMQKGSSSVTEYFGKMCALNDEMTAAGKPLDDEALTAYILNGLDLDFNPLVTSLVARVEPISLNELYSQMLSFENRLDLKQGGSGDSSVNATNRDGRGGSGGRVFWWPWTWQSRTRRTSTSSWSWRSTTPAI